MLCSLLHPKVLKVKKSFVCSFFLFAIVVAAAAPPPQLFAETPKQGGSLTVGVELGFRGFDALQVPVFLLSEAMAIGVVMERLFDIDKERNLIPVLGLSATPSADGKTWTIKLRKGVTFHDGTPFNADAVIHHWSRLLDPKNMWRGRRLIKPLKSVEKVDEFTVRAHLEHAWVPFKGLLANLRIPASYIPSPKAVDAGLHNRAPVGTGPFMFKSLEKGDRLVAIRNPNYWQKGKPYLDEIVFRSIPDHQSRFASLKTGELDLIWTDRGSHIHKARKDSSLQTYESEAGGAEIIVLNTSRPPLDDLRVRQALAHANNQALHVKLVYQDTIPVVSHPFGHYFQCDDTGYREYDPEKAKALLAEYGKPVEVELVHTNTPRGRQTGEIMQQLFKKVGVTLTPAPMDPMGAIIRVFTNNYQMTTWRMRDMPDPGPYLFASYHSSNIGIANFTNYRNAEMDRLLIEQRTSTDRKKREAAFCRIARILNDEAPILFRGGRHFYAFGQPHVKGVPPLKNGLLQVSGAWINK